MLDTVVRQAIQPVIYLLQLSPVGPAQTWGSARKGWPNKN